MRLRSTLLPAVLTGMLAFTGCGMRSPDATAGGGTPDDQDADAATGAVAPEPATEIPEDFPLAAGMAGPQDALATSRTGTGLRDLELCGTAPLRGLGIRDRMVADNSGGESADTRELVLLGNRDEAVLVAQAFADLPSRCPSPVVTGDMSTLTEVRGSPFGPSPASTLLQTYTFDGRRGTGATVVHVVPVGAALLVTSTYGQWTADTLDEGVDKTVEAARPAVTEMCVFTITGC